MSDPTNILGKIGKAVGEEIKQLSNNLSNINLNNISGGLEVTKNADTGAGVTTDGKGTFNSLEVSLGTTLKGDVTANGAITADGTISALRAETTQDLSVGSDASVAGALSVEGKVTAGSLEVKGETKIINTTSVEVSDNILELNKSTDSATTATISGLEINRGVTEATSGGEAVGSIGLNGLFPNEELTHDYTEIQLIQQDYLENDNYVYESVEKLGTGTFPQGLYRISFFKDLLAPDSSIYNNGQTAGESYDGWVLQRKDANGDYQHVSTAEITSPPAYHGIAITAISHPPASQNGTAVETHGLFTVVDTEGTLEITDNTNPWMHYNTTNGSYPFYDADTVALQNNTSTTFYVHRRVGSSDFQLVATVAGNGSSSIILASEQAYIFTTQYDPKTAGNVANGIMQITVGVSGTTTVPDPLFVRSTEALSTNIRTKFEDWNVVEMDQGDLYDGGSGTTTIYQASSGSLVPQVPALETQEVPFPVATSSSVKDKAKFLWDNAGDQQKFKFLVGDNLANLSSNSLTVPDGNGVVIGVAPLGTYADFTSALATAKE